MCVSHDRYFLEGSPNECSSSSHRRSSISMADTRSDGQEKSDERNAGETNSKSQPAKTPKQPEKPAVKIASKKDNPYARPYGRLALQDLERTIGETEMSVADAQRQFADARSGRDGQKTRNCQRNTTRSSKSSKRWKPNITRVAISRSNSSTSSDSPSGSQNL